VPLAEEICKQLTAVTILIRTASLTSAKVSVVHALDRGLQELDKGALECQDRETLSLKRLMLPKNSDGIQISEVKTGLEVVLEGVPPSLGVAADGQCVTERHPIISCLPARDMHVGVVLLHEIRPWSNLATIPRMPCEVRS
jgi:hypothetical protein